MSSINGVNFVNSDGSTTHILANNGTTWHSPTLTCTSIPKKCKINLEIEVDIYEHTDVFRLIKKIQKKIIDDAQIKSVKID